MPPRKTRADLATRADTLSKWFGEKNQRHIIESVAARHVDPVAFTTLMIYAAQRSPTLIEATPTSLLRCLVMSSRLGLEPGNEVLGQFYIVPYKNTRLTNAARRNGDIGQADSIRDATPIVGYKGLITLQMRSKLVTAVKPRLVYPEDDYQVYEGTRNELVHVPHPAPADKPRTSDDVVAAYVVNFMAEGPPQFLVMDFEELEKKRARAASTNKADSPWNTDREAMYRKSPIRAIANFMPLQAEMEIAKAIVYEDQMERGVGLGDLDLGIDPAMEADALAEAEEMGLSGSEISEEGEEGPADESTTKGEDEAF
jgi:recombination protein RecT